MSDSVRPHAKRWEPRGFSRVAAAFSSYDGDLSVATAEFSKFAGILSAALSQHHLLEFEIAQLEFHHLH